MNTLGFRLREVIAERGITQSLLVDSIEVSTQTIQQWLKDENYPSIKNILKLAEFLKVSPAWLLFGTSSDIKGYFVEVPETKIELSAGVGCVNYEVDGDGSKASYRADWFNKEGINPDRCLRVRVKGDSMMPFLYPNDVVLINLDETSIEDGGVYALRVDDELFVKRLAKVPGVGIKVMSENPEYETSVLDAEKFDGRVQIIGRVRDKSGRGGL